MGILNRLWFVVAVLLLGYIVQPATADVILSAPPRETPDEAKVLYEPLARLMEQVLGDKVVLRYPDNWSKYATDMRAGRYDAAIDEPHLVSWRIQNLGHQPIVALPGSIHYYIYAHADDGEIGKLEDLRFKTVCTEAAPNLSAVVVQAQFDGSSGPRIVPVRGNLDEAYQRFLAGECKTFVMRDSLLPSLTEAELHQIKRVFETPHYPNLTLSVGLKVPAIKREALQKALLEPKGTTATQSLIDRYGGRGGTELKRASVRSYRGYNQLLEGVIFGWDKIKD
jgi:ABC-type phosphate/phosphonate transport system substrate-binding protein